MLNALFTSLAEKDKNAAIEDIISHASPRPDFFLMMTLSVAMASFGVMLNSTVILIGSMLIAPLLYSMLSLSLGIIGSDHDLISRSLYTITKSLTYAIISSFVLGLLFANRETDFIPFSFIVSGTESLMYAVVAAISGFAAAFAVTKPNLNSTLPGVAISVSLVPPLAVAGVALSLFNWTVMSNALLLFIVNIIGIVFSAMIVFSLFKFSLKQKVMSQAVKEDEKQIEKEVGSPATEN